MILLNTILAGVSVFILGQMALKLVIDPVQKIKQTIGDIAHALINYAHVYTNSDVVDKAEVEEVYKILRSLASQLHSDMRQVPLYRVTKWVFFLPSRENIYQASKKLIALANWMYSTNEKRYEWRAKLRQDIAGSLEIFIYADEKIDKELLESSLRDRGSSSGDV